MDTGQKEALAHKLRGEGEMFLFEPIIPENSIKLERLLSRSGWKSSHYAGENDKEQFPWLNRGESDVKLPWSHRE